MYDLREVPGLRLKFVCTVLLWLTNTPMSLAIGTRIKDMTTEIPYSVVEQWSSLLGRQTPSVLGQFPHDIQLPAATDGESQRRIMPRTWSVVVFQDVVRPVVASRCRLQPRGSVH
jgi:hypothetical protein